MTNYEHYKEQIERITRLGRRVAMNATTGEIVCCGDTHCNECLFQGSEDANCSQKAFKWADEEYTEPEVDWSKIPLDTPVLVSDDKKTWVRRHFATPALKNDDYFTVRTFVDGKTEWSSEERDFCERWRYAKLAEEEE